MSKMETLAEPKWKKYYYQNKEKYLASQKKYDTTNRERLNEYKKKYREENKDELNRKRRENKFECECGKTIGNRNKQPHLLTAYHMRKVFLNPS